VGLGFPWNIETGVRGTRSYGKGATKESEVGGRGERGARYKNSSWGENMGHGNGHRGGRGKKKTWLTGVSFI